MSSKGYAGDSKSQDNSSSEEEEFDFIESTWENMVETGLIIRWPTASRALHLSTKLEEAEIAPLFNGTQWAGTRVWKAAVLALEYMLEHFTEDSSGPKSLIELGCGLGVPGILWHLLHDEKNKVVVTDMESLMSQLKENVDKNFPDNKLIHTRSLSWSEVGISKLLRTHGDFDICLSCDCIYEPLYGRDSWEALADVLGYVGKVSPKTVLVTSVERRRGDGLEQFFERLEGKGTVAPIQLVLRNDEDKHHVIEIYITYGIADGNLRT
jgi:predicted nicotinamide N-methyase